VRLEHRANQTVFMLTQEECAVNLFENFPEIFNHVDYILSREKWHLEVARMEV